MELVENHRYLVKSNGFADIFELDIIEIAESAIKVFNHFSGITSWMTKENINKDFAFIEDLTKKKEAQLEEKNKNSGRSLLFD